MIRESLEKLLEPPLRKLLHRAVFRRVDAVGDRAPARLAHHAAACGELHAAAQSFVDVAHAAEKRFRYVDAQRAYTEALANPEALDRSRQHGARHTWVWVPGLADHRVGAGTMLPDEQGGDGS